LSNGVILDGIRNQLTATTGAGVVSIPALFHEVEPNSDLGVAYIPGMVNLLRVNGNRVAMAKPFGPRDDQGQDLLEARVGEDLGQIGVGVQVDFVDDWWAYHALYGEVHCATNARRTPPGTVKWWSW